MLLCLSSIFSAKHCMLHIAECLDFVFLKMGCIDSDKELFDITFIDILRLGLKFCHGYYVIAFVIGIIQLHYANNSEGLTFLWFPLKAASDSQRGFTLNSGNLNNIQFFESSWNHL